MTIIQVLSEKLISQNLKLITAESCTGGLIAKLCTDSAGSSAWFEGSFVTYSNNAKNGMLGVDASLIEKYGAVSQVVAESMAKGALDNSEANISVSVTGIAGPDGGSEEKPVGTVWVAWSTDEKLFSEQFLFKGNREQVRKQTADKAIEGLIQFINI